jgi:bifunctional UDP-N-acetylglucosamine pyrophosphorylase/glucosamine-1-phosphate N-acetyltransferase/UDP-N-acetylglucosamine pyrophosphorylase
MPKAAMTNRLAIVLAAGQGTRMKSDQPKVLCEALGRPLLHYVLDALTAAAVDRVVLVVGYKSHLVRDSVRGRYGVEFVEQTQQLGTGHAVMVCREHLRHFDGAVLVVTGDSPLIQPESVRALLAKYDRDRPACVLGTLHKENPTGLGRILRDDQGRFVGIVEEKDATEAQRRITEVNMSTYVFDSRELLQALEDLDNDNKQGEYYLTDCPGILIAAGKDVRALPVLRPCEALSVNTLQELKIVEEELRRLGH